MWTMAWAAVLMLVLLRCLIQAWSLGRKTVPEKAGSARVLYRWGNLRTGACGDAGVCESSLWEER